MSRAELEELRRLEQLEQRGGQVPLPQQSSFDPSMMTPDTSIPSTLLKKTEQGATFGFGDEITSGIGAAIASAVDPNIEFSDAYRAGQEMSRQELEAQSEEHPVLSFGAEMGGGLIGGTGVAKGLETAGRAVPMASRMVSGAGQYIDDALTKAPEVMGRIGPAVGEFTDDVISAGRNIVSKVAPTASATGKGVVAGAAYGAGTGEEGERLQSAKESGVVGGVFGAGARPVGKMIGRLVTKTPVIGSDAIKKQAQKMYKTVDEQGGMFSANIMDDFINKIEDTIRPKTSLGRATGAESAVPRLLGALDDFRGQNMTLQAAEEFDQNLTRLVNEQLNPDGSLKPMGKELLEVQSVFNDLIMDEGNKYAIGSTEGLESLKQAKKLWSQAKKMRDIEAIMGRAETANQPASALKSGFSNLLNSSKRIRGYTPDERAAIKQVAETGRITDMLRSFGSRLVPIGATAADGGIGTVAKALAISDLSRQGASNIQVNKALDAARVIGNMGQAPKRTVDVPGAYSAVGNLADKFADYLTTVQK